MDRPAKRDTALLMGALALVLSFTPSMLKRRRRDQATVSVVAGLGGAAVGLGTEELVVRLADRLEGGEGAARAAIVGLGGVSAALRLPAHPSSGVAFAGTGAGVAGTAALIGAVAPERKWGRVEVRMVFGLVLAAGGVAMIVSRRRARVKRLARRDRPRLTHYPIARYLDTVSGGEGSLLPLAALDFEGSRFLAGAVPAAEIAVLRRRPDVLDPVRVFAGVRSADTVAERCRLAVEELDRLGGFDRGRVIVWSATLRGFVNPVPMEAAEVYRRGDVASVCVQFYDKRTALMPLKVPIATETHRELLLALRRRLAVRDAAGLPLPEIVVYGESLGAWASQNVFRESGVRGLDAVRVARALWVGTPAFARLRQRMERGAVPSDDRVAVLKTRELLEAEPAGLAGKRFFFLFRRADPVVAFSGLELIWRRPDWLVDDPFHAPGTSPPDGIPPGARWIPLVTFLQVLIDLLRATRWTSDLPKAAAHDYRIELPLAVDVALDDEVSREEAEAIADVLVAREIARAERLRALRRGEPDPGLPAPVPVDA